MKNKVVLSSFISLVLVNITLLSASVPQEIGHRYDVSVVPKHMSVQEKKERFYTLLVPVIDRVYKELEDRYINTKKLIKKNPNSKEIKNLMQIYSAKNPEDLLMRMKPHPRSIALAQSAMESAWGTSRFLRMANNVFGVWSFKKDEPRVPASKKRGNKTIYIKKYASIDDSIRDYYKVLATGRAFKKFRVQKMKTNNSYLLVKYLQSYSERGEAYGKELADMIRYNKLTKYDE